MTIDSSWLCTFKEELPHAFTKKNPFRSSAVFVDGQIKLMQAPPREPQTWDRFISRQFGRHLEKCYDMCDVVVLAFDNYDYVPRAKCMTQSKRRKHIPPVAFAEHSELPCMVPEGEHWTQCISNRTFKRRVIDLVLLRLPGLLLNANPKRRLVVDYQQPVEYRFDQASGALVRETLQEYCIMGEADVKFARFADRYGKLMVDSIDGDSIPIALMHHELCLRRATPPPLVSVYSCDASVHRMELKVQGTKRKAEDGDHDGKKSGPRTYEYVNIHALYEGLKDTIAQSMGRMRLPSHAGHEMGMLIALISLTGTDFSRNMPQMSGKSVYSFLPDIWPSLAMAYDPVQACLRVEQALNFLVPLLYKSKFPRHVSPAAHASLKATLFELQESVISERVKQSLPTVERIECSIRNTNWVLAYWTCEPAPDPIQHAYGFRLVHPGGGVEYDDKPGPFETPAP